MTREQTYRTLREKHLRRAKRRRRQGRHSVRDVHGHWRHVGRRWLLPLLGKLRRPDVLPATMGHGEKKLFYPPIWTEVEPAKNRKPPVPRILDPLVRSIIDGGNHPNYEIVGFAGRSVARIGRKETRMNAYQRKAWGAGLAALHDGFFPSWDPLQRHPNEDDYANGEPAYNGPFPTFPPEPPDA